MLKAFIASFKTLEVIRRQTQLPATQVFFEISLS